MRREPSPRTLYRPTSYFLLPMSNFLPMTRGRREREECAKIFRCVTARVALPDTRREPLHLYLEPYKNTDGKIEGPGTRPVVSTCANTIYLPRYESVAQLGERMAELLATKGFTAQ